MTTRRRIQAHPDPGSKLVLGLYTLGLESGHGRGTNIVYALDGLPKRRMVFRVDLHSCLYNDQQSTVLQQAVDGEQNWNEAYFDAICG